jgi:hypothetical protein
VREKVRKGEKVRQKERNVMREEKRKRMKENL